MKADRDASLVMDALMMAVWRRGKADALLLIRTKNRKADSAGRRNTLTLEVTGSEHAMNWRFSPLTRLEVPALDRSPNCSRPGIASYTLSCAVDRVEDVPQVIDMIKSPPLFCALWLR
jgi:hypothetical protein